jgi:hypothetical protein
MKHSWLGVGCLAAGLLFARPGFCIDNEVRNAAVDALLARDAAQAKLDAAKKDADKARAGWLKLWEGWQKGLEEAALKEAAAPPQKADDEINAAALEQLSKALDDLKAKVAKATPDATEESKGKLSEIEQAIDTTKKEVEEQHTRLASLENALTVAETKKKVTAEAFAKNTGPVRYLAERLRAGRQLRCITAYCYGGVDGTKFAIEPVLDLPVGLVWSAGNGALTSYVNSHTVNVEFNAGLRFWLGYDIMSVSLYFSKPLITGNDPIRVSGSSFEHSPDAIHRPFPSIGLGFAGDAVTLGISYDQLRNGATDNKRDPAYPANSVLSRSLTFSLGISLFNLSKQALAQSHDDSKTPAREAPGEGGTP